MDTGFLLQAIFLAAGHPVSLTVPADSGDVIVVGPSVDIGAIAAAADRAMVLTIPVPLDTIKHLSAALDGKPVGQCAAVRLCLPFAR